MGFHDLSQFPRSVDNQYFEILSVDFDTDFWFGLYMGVGLILHYSVKGASTHVVFSPFELNPGIFVLAGDCT